MEKKKNRYIDDDVMSRGRDVTKEDNEKAGYGKEENDANNEEEFSVFSNQENQENKENGAESSKLRQMKK